MSTAARKWFEPTSIPARVRKELADRGVTVRRVRDSGRPLTLNVTKTDISRGKRKDPLGCAGAQCAMRQEHADAAVIRAGIAYVIKGAKATRYVVGPTVRQQLVLFDRAGRFDPGEYTLGAVPQSQKLGAWRPASSAVKGNGGGKAPGYTFIDAGVSTTRKRTTTKKAKRFRSPKPAGMRW